ncbi:DgyrCDS7381 [Dimorphilus gyrociliatus]|uniref:DgyrCDS7381 n=1 Tax=Dimorphilus gyrociliatus TaxID=2664684 RepID=A0A7I8VQV4_9ANNE|nr:DgyrCDS7381 [Dimorphilus gyrociliatus]
MDRNVDGEGNKASMSVPQLNNMVIILRKYVKQAKVRCIRKLTQDIQKLRKNKKLSKDKAERKVQKTLEEISLIKSLKPDMVSKFALSNTEKFDGNKTEGKIAHKSLLRLANCSVLENFVQKWREEHSDWQSLAAFVSTKNTGRRFKQKVKTEKEKKVDRLLAEEEIERLKSKMKGGSISKLFESKNKKKEAIPEESLLDQSENDEDSTDSEEYVTCYEELEKTPSPEATQPKETKKENIKFDNEEKVDKQSTQNKKLMEIKEFDLMNETDEISVDNSIILDSDVSQKKRNRDNFFLAKDADSDDGASEIEESDEEMEETNNTDIKRKKNVESVFVTSLSTKNNKRKNFAPKKMEKTQKNKPFAQEKPKEKSFAEPKFKKKPEKREIAQGEKLHPSWEAKRKANQQPSLNSYSGTRITFDDD